jgi:hypothetical protein
MRKFVKVAIIVCLSVAAVPAVLFGWLAFWTWYRTAQVESFYQEHRLLNDMRAVETESTNDSGSARQALLQILPLGTDREAAVGVLRGEGFGCQTIAEPTADTRLRQRFMEASGLTNIPNDGRTRTEWMDCQAQGPALMGYRHWIVELEFVAGGHLNDARIAVWNIFL